MRAGNHSSYFDTSVVAALLISEPLSSRAERFLATCEGLLLVSNLTVVEFSSLVARRLRMREFTLDQARAALADFDAWTVARCIEVSPVDLIAATALLRRLDTSLRALDAIHVAVAQRLDATLVTFDRQMADRARALGTAVATP